MIRLSALCILGTVDSSTPWWHDWGSCNDSTGGRGRVVFKKGGRDLAENYRPVSLTCVCCKILEHIITSHIRQHLDHNNILSAYQHGFRKLHSCETQLLVTVQDLLFKRDNLTSIYQLIWPFWIFPRPLILYHTDACWGNWAPMA